MADFPFIGTDAIRRIGRIISPSTIRDAVNDWLGDNPPSVGPGSIGPTELANGAVVPGKTGNGNWRGAGSESLTAALAALESDKQATAEKGQANGYASLGGDGLVPVAQLRIANAGSAGLMPAALFVKVDDLPADVAGELTSLATALSGKADAVHTQPIGTVSGLQDALDAKADASALAGKADLNHTQPISTVTGLQSALNGLQNAIDNIELEASSFEGIQGDPTDNTALADALAAKADAIHVQPISTVTGLQSALDGKASTAALTGKQNTSERGQPGGYASLDLDGRVPLSQLPDDIGGGGGGAGGPLDFGTIDNPAGFTIDFGVL